MQDWHNKKIAEIFEYLQTNKQGLDTEEVKARLQKSGYNTIEAKKSTPVILIFLHQFLNPLVYILIVAAIIKFIIGIIFDGAVIVGVILLMAAIGFFQEFRAEKAMEALKKLAAPKTKVYRNGNIELVETKNIVAGDILVLESGDKIPADARVIEASNLNINESILTGESVTVEKEAKVVEKEASLTERINMLFMGTVVTYGRALAVVVATGMSTEIGKIAGAIKDVKSEKTPLQKSINTLGKWMILITISVLSLLTLIGLSKGMPLQELFLLSVAAVVAAIPEGLPAVVTVVLAVGMQTMAKKRKAIIRKLVAVETLGSTTVICTDKTGTLTLNQMTVKKFWQNGQEIESSDLDKIKDNEKFIMEIGVLCNDASLKDKDGKTVVIGDPTEGALLDIALKAGINKKDIEAEQPRLKDIPFQSENQYMATLHKKKDELIAYIKGSPEKIISLCSQKLENGKLSDLADSDIKNINDKVEKMARKAMRVLALAYTDNNLDENNFKEEHISKKLIFVGLVGMIDPPRQEAADAVSQCKKAGIRVIMVTGDNSLTAKAIAEEVGIDTEEVITGKQLNDFSDEELAKKVVSVSVFARIEPLHKLRIVRAIKKLGNIVAMTGDGVNDAPALEAADIGIAMGLTGTDVAKEASDVILADDNFASIVAAVEEGRIIFNRLRNAVAFLLTTCFGELSVLVLAIFYMGITPLVPIQIIWINLVTGALIAIPLGFEPKAGNELLLPPRHPKVGLIYPGMVLRIFFLSTTLGLSSFLLFMWSLSHFPLEKAQTIVFCSIVIFEWLVALSLRSDEISIFKLGFFKNKHLLKAIALALFLQIIVVYVSFLQPIFNTVSIDALLWAVAILPGFAIFILEILRKILFPKIFSLGKWMPVKESNS